MEVIPKDGKDIATCPHCQKPFKMEIPSAIPDEPIEDHEPVEYRQSPEFEKSESPAPVTETQHAALMTVQPNLFRRYPGRVLFYLTIMFAGLALIVYSISDDWLLALIGGLGLVTFGAIRMGAWYARTRSTSLTITSQSVIMRQGTFTQQATEVRYEDIQDIQPEQTFTNRLFNVGDVAIVTKGNLMNFVVRGIPDPESVVRMCRTQQDLQRGNPVETVAM